MLDSPVGRAGRLYSRRWFILPVSECVVILVRRRNTCERSQEGADKKEPWQLDGTVCTVQWIPVLCNLLRAGIFTPSFCRWAVMHEACPTIRQAENVRFVENCKERK